MAKQTFLVTFESEEVPWSGRRVFHLDSAIVQVTEVDPQHPVVASREIPALHGPERRYFSDIVHDFQVAKERPFNVEGTNDFFHNKLAERFAKIAEEYVNARRYIRGE